MLFANQYDQISSNLIICVYICIYIYILYIYHHISYIHNIYMYTACDIPYIPVKQRSSSFKRPKLSPMFPRQNLVLVKNRGRSTQVRQVHHRAPFLVKSQGNFCWVSGVMYTGWWFEPLWKIWVRQLGLLFQIYGKIKNVPNHQPVQ